MTLENLLSEITDRGWKISHINRYDFTCWPDDSFYEWTCVIIKEIPGMELGIIKENGASMAEALLNVLTQTTNFNPIELTNLNIKHNNKDQLRSILDNLLKKPNKPAFNRRI